MKKWGIILFEIKYLNRETYVEKSLKKIFFFESVVFKLQQQVLK